MLSQIRNDEEKKLYIDKMKEIDEMFARQSILPKGARVGKEVVLKLEKLYQYLEKEVWKYDKIQRQG